MFQNIFSKYFTTKNILFFISAILFIILVLKLSDIAIMFFASFVIACSLEPIVKKLQNKFPRTVSCTIVLLGALLVLCAFVVPVIAIGGYEIKKFAVSFPQYIDNIRNYIGTSPIAKMINLNQIDISKAIGSLSGTSSQIIADTINAGKNIGSAFVYFIVSVLIVYYFMVDRTKVKNSILRLFPKEIRTRAGEILSAIAERSGGYVIAQIVTMASIGVVVSIGLFILKSEYAILLGLISAVFDIIPVVGPAIAFVICIIVVYKSGAVITILTAVLFGIAQLIENNFIRPYVFGKFLDIHPLLIYLFLFITAKYMGVIGVIFAPAIAATTAVLIEEVYIKNIE